MKAQSQLKPVPTFEELKKYYLSRNGVPITKRSWLDDPFDMEDNFFKRIDYQTTKHFAYQDAIHSYEREQDFPFVTVKVHSDFYPPLFDTYLIGQIQFHGDDNCWRSKVYTNPNYGDLINAASRYYGYDPMCYHDFGIFKDYKPNYVNDEPDSNGVIGVYL